MSNLRGSSTGLIWAQMRPVLERCIANAIQTHFQYGPGREVIEAEVAKVLAPGEGKIS